MNEEERMSAIKAMAGEMAEGVMKEGKDHMLKHGYVPGAVIGFDGHGKCRVSLPMEWGSPQERSRVLLTFKILLMIRGVILYTVIHEAWAKAYMGEEAMKAVESHQWGDISKEPDREEIISVLVVSHYHVEARACKVIREGGEGTKVIGFEDMEHQAFTDGDLANLIPRREGSGGVDPRR